MNNRQRIAFYNPCRFASERSGRIFRAAVVIGKYTVLTCLTSDTFSGFPVWHVSGSVINDQGKPVNLFAKIPRTEAVAIGDYLKSLLNGVGAGEVTSGNSVTELNFYKRSSDEERSLQGAK